MDFLPYLCDKKKNKNPLKQKDHEDTDDENDGMDADDSRHVKPYFLRSGVQIIGQ